MDVKKQLWYLIFEYQKLPHVVHLLIKRKCKREEVNWLKVLNLNLDFYKWNFFSKWYESSILRMVSEKAPSGMNMTLFICFLLFRVIQIGYPVLMLVLMNLIKYKKRGTDSLYCYQNKN